MRMMAAATVALVTILAVRRGLHEPDPLPQVEPRPVAPQGPPPAERDVYVDGIMKRNLFDVEALQGWSRGDEAMPLSKASLDVMLLGTVAADDPRLSTAFVRYPDGRTRYHGPGDLLEGYRIGEITRRRVVLVSPQDGALVVLRVGDGEPSDPSD